MAITACIIKCNGVLVAAYNYELQTTHLYPNAKKLSFVEFIGLADYISQIQKDNQDGECSELVERINSLKNKFSV